MKRRHNLRLLCLSIIFLLISNSGGEAATIIGTVGQVEFQNQEASWRVYGQPGSATSTGIHDEATGMYQKGGVFEYEKNPLLLPYDTPLSGLVTYSAGALQFSLAGNQFTSGEAVFPTLLTNQIWITLQITGSPNGNSINLSNLQVNGFAVADSNLSVTSVFGEGFTGIKVVGFDEFDTLSFTTEFVFGSTGIPPRWNQMRVEIIGVETIPEPSSTLLILFGIAALGIYFKSRVHSAFPPISVPLGVPPPHKGEDPSTSQVNL